MPGLDKLRSERVWVAWNSDGGRKVPKTAGGNARSNDPSTWLTYGEASALASEMGYSGVGVMLSGGLTGIDLDGCVEDGAIAPWAQDVIDKIVSYAEVSPSGTGVHILCYADPAKVGAVGRADHARGIEVYNHGRYFTVTGDEVGGGTEIADRTGELSSFVADAFPSESAEDSAERAVGSLVRNQVARRANETVISNARRDRKSGVRFARVPMGSETCDFCMMLASRGFVYHSDKTAGEFDHFHASCRCKVVPGFPTMERYVKNGVRVSRGLDPSVEGYDPDRYFDMWKHPEKYAGTYAERKPAKWTEAKERCVSDLDAVESRGYKEALASLFGSDLAESVHHDIYHTLKVRSGTFFESLYAYDLTTWERISFVDDCNEHQAVYPSDEMKSSIASAIRAGHDVATFHNHPESSMPSASDLVAAAKNGEKFGVIACHDGTIFKYRVLDDRYKRYTKTQVEALQQTMSHYFSHAISLGKSEADILVGIGNLIGGKIEHIRPRR